MTTMKKTTVCGFTLIELLVGVSVIAILSLASIPVFTNVGTNQTLTQNVENLKSDLKLAQEKAISGAVSGVYPNTNGLWGARFNCDPVSGKATSYILGQPQDPSDAASTIISGTTKTFTYNVYIYCAAPFQVVFGRLTGKPTPSSVTIVLKDDNGHQRSINIGSEGGIR